MVWQRVTPLGCRDLDAHLQLAGVLLMLQASKQGKGCCASLGKPPRQPCLSSTNKSETSPSGEAVEGSGPVEDALVHTARQSGICFPEGRKQARITTESGDHHPTGLT